MRLRQVIHMGRAIEGGDPLMGREIEEAERCEGFLRQLAPDAP